MDVEGKAAIVTGGPAGIARTARELGGRFVHADALADDDLRAL